MAQLPGFDGLIGNIEHKLSAAGREPMVDVVVNIYGKPMNTAATLCSLLQHSGRWIDKIFFTTERKQPANSDFTFITQAFGGRMVQYTPKLWLWVRPFRWRFLYTLPPFRRAARYQHGWEQTDKDYLFITHNDVLYTGDIIGYLLQGIDRNIGIGQVGQCWNCSAHFAKVCTPDTYTEYKPDYTQLKELMARHPGSREKDYHGLPRKDRPWPLPECRLNEWTALINMKIAREVTMPWGDAVPFGAFFGLDIGTQWFSDVLNMGYTVKHFDITPFAHHAWTSSHGSGHAALLNADEYTRSEKVAEEWVKNEIELNHDL